MALSTAQPVDLERHLRRRIGTRITRQVQKSTHMAPTTTLTHSQDAKCRKKESSCSYRNHCRPTTRRTKSSTHKHTQFHGATRKWESQSGSVRLHVFRYTGRFLGTAHQENRIQWTLDHHHHHIHHHLGSKKRRHTFLIIFWIQRRIGRR